MKRIFGTWILEESCDENSIHETGELIVDENDIEFYRQGGGEVFPTAFICNGGDLHRYKVIAQACRDSGTRKTLDHSSNYRVWYVLQQNGDFRPGLRIDNIAICSFVIPELIDWLGKSFTEFVCSDEGELLIKERKFQSIRLKDAEPCVEIIFESNTCKRCLEVDNRTTAIVSVQPRVQIKYSVPVAIEDVERDIGFIMQFYGLMIGRVSVAQDIRLTIRNQDMKCWLYLNRDYSYNQRAVSIVDRPRTNLRKTEEDILHYFSSWYSFCKDEQNDLIRKMYFYTNDRTYKVTEDIFLQYVKILEGFSLREANEETAVVLLETAIKKCKKEIKGLIFNDEGKPLFAAVLKEALPDWEFNASHAEQIASWIATGYIGKKGLAERLKELDSKYMNLLTGNAAMIMELPKVKIATDVLDEEGAKNEFIQRIVRTRNFFAHYKANCDGILDTCQWDSTILSLKALVIAILYSKMDMQADMIREILMYDAELCFQTMYLRKGRETSDNCSPANETS